MKYLCHVPTEQYGFISCEVEGSAEDAAEAYKEVKLFFGQVAKKRINDKEFGEIYDEYLKTGKVANGGEFYEDLTTVQKIELNGLKKSKNRNK